METLSRIDALQQQRRQSTTSLVEIMNSLTSFQPDVTKMGRLERQELKILLMEMHKDLYVVREVIEPPISHVRHLINQMMEGIDIQYPDCHKEMYISYQGETWRYLIYPEYKAKRPPKPRMIDEVVQLLINEFGATYEDGLEADDTICMTAAKYSRRDIPWVIASVDKDFYQIPGLH